jgi:hypothetical protein
VTHSLDLGRAAPPRRARATARDGDATAMGASKSAARANDARSGAQARIRVRETTRRRAMRTTRDAKDDARCDDDDDDDDGGATASRDANGAVVVVRARPNGRRRASGGSNAMEVRTRRDD